MPTTIDPVQTIKPITRPFVHWAYADWRQVWKLTTLSGTVVYDTDLIVQAELRAVRRDGSFLFICSLAAGNEGTLVFNKGTLVATDPSTMTIALDGDYCLEGSYRLEFQVLLDSTPDWQEPWILSPFTIKRTSGPIT